MYWALELVETYADFLWVRLIIIANEDIGLADPTVIVLTKSLRIQFYLVRKKKGCQLADYSRERNYRPLPREENPPR